MDPAKAFAAANGKLALAKEKLTAMKCAPDLDQLAQFWTEFLTEQHRVFLRLRKATEKGPSKGWFDNIINEQRTDDLLMYLLHARDAVEHGIDPVTAKKGAKMAVRAKPGLTSVHIKEMVVDSRPGSFGIKMDPETAAQVDLVFTPEGVHLVPVTDRNTVYQPPVRHLNKAIPTVSPITVAELAVAYLESKLSEASTKFGL